MTIAQGTVNAGTAPLNTDAIMDAMGAAIDAHASWAFVEEVTGVVGGRRTRIYFNAAQGIYIGLAKAQTAATAFGVFLFEAYDAVNKKATKFLPTTAGGLPSNANSADDSFVGSKHVADETTQTSLTTGFIWTSMLGVIAATTVAWRILVTPTGVVYSYGTGTAVVTRFLGALDVPAGTRWRAPWGYGSPYAIDGDFGVNRCVYATANGILNSLGVNPSGAWKANTSKDQNLGAYVYSPIPILSSTGAHYFGTLKDVISFDTAQIAALPDDTVTLNGVSYTCFGNDIWARTAA